MDESVFTPAIVLLVAGNVVASLYALSNAKFMDRNLFHVGPILQNQEWHRLLTSGFLHGGFLHLFVNMYVLLMFGSDVETKLGTTAFLIVYFAALLGGNAARGAALGPSG